MMVRPDALRRRAYAVGHDPTPVLVIDDDPPGEAATLGWLAGAGYRATAEPDGDRVLRLVRAERVRLVVSELYIRCAEGPCVVAVLMGDRARIPRLHVLVYTRHTSPASDAWALAAGCDSVLHEPTAPATCVRELRRLDGADAVEPSDGGSA
jgi:CheY-like chemotaxis protein